VYIYTYICIYKGAPASSTSSPGVFSSYSPHLLLFSLMAASSWAQGFVQAVHRCTIHAVVSSRYFAGAAPAPPGPSRHKPPPATTMNRPEPASPPSPAPAPGSAASGGAGQGGAFDFSGLDTSQSQEGTYFSKFSEEEDTSHKVSEEEDTCLLLKSPLYRDLNTANTLDQ
jgi:hypothetical protein